MTLTVPFPTWGVVRCTRFGEIKTHEYLTEAEALAAFEQFRDDGNNVCVTAVDRHDNEIAEWSIG